MRILFFVPYIPSLIRVRSFNLIRELTARGHQVTVATVHSSNDEVQDIAKLIDICQHVELAYLPTWRSYWNCLLALPTQKPLQAVYSWQPSLVRKLNHSLSDGKFTNNFDVVHVEHLRGSQYGLSVKEKESNLPVVWDSVDCISLLFRLAAEQSRRRISRWITLFELGRNQRYERWLLNTFDHTLVTSHNDKAAMLKLSESSSHELPNISVLMNGVDLEYFKPDILHVREAETLVVSGKMSYHANVAMVLNLVENIMPFIWASRPNVKLMIVGKDPSEEIRALGKNPKILVTGTVDDIRPYLRRATVAVTPIKYGVGIQNKVLEAMACGTPVVSTPPAVSTLDITPGINILVAEKPDNFAENVLQLINKPTFSEKVGRAGLQYVQNNHRWSTVAERLEGIYTDAILQARNSSDLKTNNLIRL